MAATIKDIARLAGVSTATVSRVLSHKGRYSEKTETKIRKIAQQLGYRKNQNATELVTRQSSVLGVIVSATQTNFSDAIIKGIETEAQKHDLSVIILYAGENNEQLQHQAIQTVLERRISGILLLSLELNSANMDLLKESGVPFLFLSIAFKDRTIPFISSDDFDIGYHATRFLIEQGHRRIGFAGANITQSFTGVQRLLGYQKAMAETQLNWLPDWIQSGDYSYQSGEAAMKKFGRHTDLSAIIGASDLAAIGVLNQAQEFGLRIPDDLSVLSIDGTDLCTIVRPKLTSMTQSFYEMGVRGVQELSQNNLVSAFIDTRLSVRDSVACLTNIKRVE
jgi:Transcriptional regulators